MTIDREYFVDVFGDIVNEVRKEYDPIGLENPYYLYGHPLDISNQLQCIAGSSETRFKKYPLICLLLDLPENHEKSDVYDYSVNPTVLVLTESLKEWNSIERTEHSFKPVLNPITKILIQKINVSEHLLNKSMNYEYLKTDKYFWGKEGIKMRGYEGLIFNDFLDGIELNFKELQILENDCI